MGHTHRSRPSPPPPRPRVTWTHADPHLPAPQAQGHILHSWPPGAPVALAEVAEHQQVPAGSSLQHPRLLRLHICVHTGCDCALDGRAPPGRREAISPHLGRAWGIREGRSEMSQRRRPGEKQQQLHLCWSTTAGRVPRRQQADTLGAPHCRRERGQRRAAMCTVPGMGIQSPGLYIKARSCSRSPCRTAGRTEPTHPTWRLLLHLVFVRWTHIHFPATHLHLSCSLLTPPPDR